MAAVTGMVECSTHYQFKLKTMERMRNLYKTLKNTDNPHGL